MKEKTKRQIAAKEILALHNAMEVRKVKLSTILRGVYMDKDTGRYRYSGRGYDYVY